MMATSHENLSPQVLQIITRQIRELACRPPEGIKPLLNELALTEIQADIEGPIGTPYETGIFRCKIVLSNDFPNTAPRGFFLTKIFHPNVSTNGEICVNTLKMDWKPNLGISHIFQVIRCLLIVPFPESALNETASKLFLESYDEYEKRARLMTSIHAKRTSKVNEDSNLVNEEPKEVVNINKRRKISPSANPPKQKLSQRKRSLKRL